MPPHPPDPDTDRLTVIEAAAVVLAGEIEWADFPSLANGEWCGRPEDPGAYLFKDGLRQFAGVVTCDPSQVDEMRTVVRGMIELLRRARLHFPTRKEPLLEAAGLVQAALKALLAELFEAANGGVAAVHIRQACIRTKFRSLSVPIQQAPPMRSVGSMREQLANLAAGRPQIDPEDGEAAREGAEAKSDVPKLGPCCACGRSDRLVRNMLSLDKKSPIAGRGWGCLVCDLPNDGAVAVVCDECLGAPLRWACRGYPGSDGRVPFDSLAGTHQHNMARHPEATAEAAR